MTFSPNVITKATQTPVIPNFIVIHDVDGL